MVGRRRTSCVLVPFPGASGQSHLRNRRSGLLLASTRPIDMTAQLTRVLVEGCRDRPASSVQLGLCREHRQYSSPKLSAPAIHVRGTPTDNNGVGPVPETAQDNGRCLGHCLLRPRHDFFNSVGRTLDQRGIMNRGPVNRGRGRAAADAFAPNLRIIRAHRMKNARGSRRLHTPRACNLRHLRAIFEGELSLPHSRAGRCQLVRRSILAPRTPERAC